MTKFLNRKLYCIALLVLCSYAGFGQGYDTTKWRFSNPKQFGFTVFDVDFIDNNNGLAVADAGIARTTDGGKNWSYGPFTYVNAAGLLARGNFLDVHYITSTVAYATGTAGLMAKTADGGLTWSFVTTPLFANNRNINTVWFLNKDTGYIGGRWFHLGFTGRSGG